MLKSLLASIGFGQSDLIYAFGEALKRLDRRELVTPERRIGQAQAIDAMIEVLRDEDVMNGETVKEIKAGLDRWVQKGPKAPKQP